MGMVQFNKFQIDLDINVHLNSVYKYDLDYGVRITSSSPQFHKNKLYGTQSIKLKSVKDKSTTDLQETQTLPRKQNPRNVNKEDNI